MHTTCPRTATLPLAAFALLTLASAATTSAQVPEEDFAAAATAGAAAAGRAVLYSCDIPTNRVGFGYLQERPSEEGVKAVDIYLRLYANTGITRGKHAVHIHETASCNPCGTAGGHFDPGPNSNTSPDGNHPFHAGDLTNMTLDRQGRGYHMVTTTRVTLSDGPLSVFDEDGSAFIIHTNPDTYCPEGEAAGCAGGSRAGLRRDHALSVELASMSDRSRTTTHLGHLLLLVLPFFAYGCATSDSDDYLTPDLPATRRGPEAGGAREHRRRSRPERSTRHAVAVVERLLPHRRADPRRLPAASCEREPRAPRARRRSDDSGAESLGVHPPLHPGVPDQGRTPGGGRHADARPARSLPCRRPGNCPVDLHRRHTRHGGWRRHPGAWSAADRHSGRGSGRPELRHGRNVESGRDPDVH